MANLHKLFVNLPVRNLKKSQEFFGELGFSFNPQFTDETPPAWSSARTPS